MTRDELKDEIAAIIGEAHLNSMASSPYKDPNLKPQELVGVMDYAERVLKLISQQPLPQDLNSFSCMSCIHAECSTYDSPCLECSGWSEYRRAKP